MKTRVCVICNEEFIPIKGRQKVCFNKKCRIEKKRMDHINEKIRNGFHIGYKNRKCTICGKIYKPKTSRDKSCSSECRLLLVREIKNKLQKKYHDKRKKTDMNYIVKRKIRLMVGRIIKGQKEGHSLDIVGYSCDDFIKNIEKKLSNGMNWSNYGLWHIDHIRPLASFCFYKNGEIDYNEIKKSMSLDNLQPLWAYDNLSKGAKYENKGN